MSLKPVVVPTSALIFKDVSVRGYWLSWQIDSAPDDPGRLSMYEELSAMAAAGELTPPPYELVCMEEHREAIARSMTGYKSGKVIFDMR